MPPQDKYRVDLKQVTDAIGSVTASLNDAVAKQRVTEDQIRQLRLALQECEKYIRAQCCDRQFFCDF